MNLIKSIFVSLVVIITFTSCNKWNSNTVYVNFASDETLNIENPKLTVTVYGYDLYVADVAATIITTKEMRCNQIPCKIAIDIPANAQKLIEYTTDKGNDRYYLALEWDSNNDGEWDINIDYDKNFSIDIYTSKIQTVYLKDYKNEN